MKSYNKVLKKLQKQTQFDLSIATIQEDLELIYKDEISALLQQRRNRIYRGR